MFLNRYFFSFSFLVHLQWNNCSLFQETCFKVVCAKTGNFFMVSAQSLSLLVFVHESITFQKNKNSRKKLSFTFQFWQKICFTIFSQCSYTFQKKLVWKFWTFEILHQQIYPFSFPLVFVYSVWGWMQIWQQK